MKNSSRLILWISLCVFNIGYLSAQIAQNSLGIQRHLTSNKPMMETTSLETTWEEDANARTPFSATYYSEDGQIKIRQSSRPINYHTGNKWMPIDANLSPLNEGWGAINQPYPTYLHADGSFEISIGPTQRFSLGKNCKINGQPIQQQFEFEGNSVHMPNVASSVDKEIFFRENGVKYNYVLSQALAGNQDVVFSEEIELPEGISFELDKAHGEETKNGWAGDIQLMDQSKNVVGTLYLPVCIDNANNYAKASYRIRKEGTKQILEITVSQDWLNDPVRSYPVVIDPIVTGPTAAWVGGSMPSCMIPTYNQDSIQVTIPAGVMVTELNVTASFYADPFTPAYMADGAMFFSTDCDNSQTFTITGATGQVAGTAYLDYYNLFNPLTCCFPESCNPTDFWLSFHLGRTQYGAGCNTTYIRYDPATTSWPFEAVVVGKTPETYAGQWSVSPTPICSNDCSIAGTAYAYYGVPPYTFTHPWSNDTITQGASNGCATGATNHNFILTIPNCPDYCDSNFTSLDVPPAVIIDACGNAVGGLPTKTVPIKTAPQVTTSYDTLVCSGEPFTIQITPCLPQADILWNGNGGSGTTDINDSIINSTTSITSVNYIASASYNGCYSDTISFPLYIQPLPNAEFSYEPEPIVAALTANFYDETEFFSAIGDSWNWTFGEGTFSSTQNPLHTYVEPGEYEICLSVVDVEACANSVCKNITVVPAEVNRPNIVTPNNDGVNDLLEFTYLEFYPDNELLIFNRWGNLIHQQRGYTNDWYGAEYKDGTYFYMLTIDELNQTHTGFFELVK
jgi:gliding motility-associated-like protein